MDQLVNILGWILFILNVGFPFLMLFGFFDDRRNGSYRFRLKRFLSIALFIALFNMAGGVAVLDKLGDTVMQAPKVAEKAVLANRVGMHYAQENEGTLFAQVFNKETKECWRAALSNYVEDQWDSVAHDQACARDKRACGISDDAYTEIRRNELNPEHVALLDLAVIGQQIDTIWSVAPEFYNNIRRLDGSVTRDGKKAEPLSEKDLAKYQNYITKCSSLKPVAWADIDTPLITKPARFCIGACP